MSSLQSFLFQTLCSFPAVIIAITVQGYAKAKMADKLGDKLPRFQGRVTLNPSAHIDVIGLVMLVLFKFGWTKPVETNPSSYKRGKKDSLKVSVAPLIGNLVTALIFAFIYVAVYYFALPYLPDSAATVLSLMLVLIVQVNLSIMVFNILPIPGLCGWSILKDINPKLFFKISGKIYQYQLPILLALVLLGGYIISPVVSFFYSLFIKLALLFFGLFL